MKDLHATTGSLTAQKERGSVSTEPNELNKTSENANRKSCGRKSGCKTAKKTQRSGQELFHKSNTVQEKSLERIETDGITRAAEIVH